MAATPHKKLSVCAGFFFLRALGLIGVSIGLAAFYKTPWTVPAGEKARKNPSLFPRRTSAPRRKSIAPMFRLPRREGQGRRLRRHDVRPGTFGSDRRGKNEQDDRRRDLLSDHRRSQTDAVVQEKTDGRAALAIGAAGALLRGSRRSERRFGRQETTSQPASRISFILLLPLFSATSALLHALPGGWLLP